MVEKQNSCDFQELSTSAEWRTVEAVLGGLAVPACLLISGSIAYANSACLRLFRVERRAIIGRPFGAIASGEQHRAVMPDLGLGSEGYHLKGSHGTIRVDTLNALRICGKVVVQITFGAPDVCAPDEGSAWMRQALESTRDCIHVLDLDGRLRWMNSVAGGKFRLAGDSEISDTQWLSFWTEMERSAASCALEQARAGGHGRFEAYHRTDSGEDTWWDVSVTAALGPYGKPQDLIAVSRDITDRRRAETELSRKSAQMEIVVDGVPALIAYVDADGKYQWANRKYEEWYGIPSSDLVGRYWYDVLTQYIGNAYAEQLRPHVEEVLAGSQVTFEAHHNFAGRRRDLLLSYSPDFDSCGRVQGFVLLVSDLTEQRRAQKELSDSDERFRTLAETLPSIAWAASPDGELNYISDRFRQMTGIDPEGALGSGWTRVIHPEDMPATAQQWKAALKSGTVFEMQYRLLQHNGTYRWYLARALPQRDSSGEILRWVGVSTDIHRQVSAEQAVRESERRYRLLFDDNPLPMWTYDTQILRFTSVNDTAIKAYGYSREEFLSMLVTDIRPEEDVAGLLPALHNPAVEKPIGPVRHRRKDGSVFWVEITSYDSTEAPGTLRLVVAQDVSERVRLNEELLRRAEHDWLTGLPNRQRMTDQFLHSKARAQRNQTRLGVLAIDFDRFKHVNDTFGHQIGDEFLKTAAQRLRSRLRSSDTLARVGGDEFVVIAEDICSVDAAMEVAMGVTTAVQDPIAVQGVTLQPTISVGLAIYPDDGEELDDLLRRADYGLYQAKRSGRNCFRRYMRSDKQGVQEGMQIERALRTGLEHGRFELHYQPLFSCRGEVRSLEALIRFPHPEFGLLSPARFIPIAEESGLIHDLGLWVFREACRQIRQWRDEGLEVVPIAVNVSAAQFSRGSLACQVRRVLEEFQVEPDLLEIELTESLLMDNTEQACQQLQLLKSLGIRIAVDDFGTGYSSLSYLHSLPLDSLKIDRSFVQKIAAGESNPIVKAIVELGKTLGLRVVAEGVETEEQYQELVQLQCDLLQGYLFAVPEPASVVSHLLRRPAVTETGGESRSGPPTGNSSAARCVEIIEFSHRVAKPPIAAPFY